MITKFKCQLVNKEGEVREEFRYKVTAIELKKQH
jgi:hypothetical protein